MVVVVVVFTRFQLVELDEHWGCFEVLLTTIDVLMVASFTLQSSELNYTRYFIETSPIFTSPWPRTVGRFTQFKPFNVTALVRTTTAAI